MPSSLKEHDTIFKTERGRPWPLGAQNENGGVNFSLISESARRVVLMLYNNSYHFPFYEVELAPELNRTGDIWHIFISGLKPWCNYAYKIYADDPQRHNGQIVIDPYAKATSGGELWGQPVLTQTQEPYALRLGTVVDSRFDWEADTPLNRPLADTIIYELHVRGFTKHSSSQIMKPGTFAGIIEKIPYLKKLGITAVELMPVTDFDETGVPRRNPKTGKKLKNYWGYDPISFFALKSAYAHDASSGGAIIEFKKMVKALHKAGIEIILDMVFNHTAEGNEQGEIYNFKGLDRDTYYIYDAEKSHYQNYTGCGNTVNCNHPVVRSMIIDALRYWVTEMHVDGFRFDLASIMSRGSDGQVLPSPPILERIALDPVLKKTKIIAEAWDAAGLYQVGSFPHWKRWVEWNGRYRDDLRRFIKGEMGLIPTLAQRLTGSSDLYEKEGRSPLHSINFVSCHDGFPLADLVMYNKKHNIENGEEDRDGENHNLSFNYGVEGPTENREINEIRIKQIKNFAALLFLSQGVPMFAAGDEFGRTQGGNNNAYCQDNAISWLDWSLLDTNKEIFAFFQKMITLRKRYPVLKRTEFKVKTINGQPELSWHGTEINQPDWSEQSRTLALYLRDKANTNLYIIINGEKEAHAFTLPQLPASRTWIKLIDTAQKVQKKKTVSGERVEAPAHSIVICSSKSASS